MGGSWLRDNQTERAAQRVKTPPSSPFSLLSFLYLPSSSPSLPTAIPSFPPADPSPPSARQHLPVCLSSAFLVLLISNPPTYVPVPDLRFTHRKLDGFSSNRRPTRTELGMGLDRKLGWRDGRSSRPESQVELGREEARLEAEPARVEDEGAEDEDEAVGQGTFSPMLFSSVQTKNQPS